MKTLRDNGLSITLTVLFLIFWAGQAVSGWKVHNEDAVRHGRAEAGFPQYLASGHFWQATAENWESEFLQMGAYVILTTFLFQRGSAESNDPDGESAKAAPEERKRYSFFYRNSLSLMLLALFAVSFVMHLVSGLAEFNEEQTEHGEPARDLEDFLAEPEFWFQSFQNWQSEFLAVLSIVGLSIFLRQDGSPESKAITDPHSKTGK